jgi:hypothetical protein
MFAAKKKGYAGKTVREPIKPVKLNQCDVDILNFLKDEMREVISIHEKLAKYSDQEISLNLSWLEKKNFIKKVITHNPFGMNSISYTLDYMGKDFFGK